MKVGKVIGAVDTSAVADSLDRQHFVLVHSQEQYVAAVDQAGAKPGDQVLMVTGSAASKFCMEAPVDAVVVAVVDQDRLGSEHPLRSPDKSVEQTMEDAHKPL